MRVEQSRGDGTAAVYASPACLIATDLAARWFQLRFSLGKARPMSRSCLRRRNPCARTRRLFLEQFESRVLLAALPPLGLMDWYRAEGNANDFVGTHDGTLQGGIGFAAGEVQQAFNMDGVDDSVDLGTWFNLQSFTIDLWVNPAPGANQVAFADILDNNHTGTRSW